MAKSLQEQLMGSGLVDKKKAKSIQKEKRKNRKQAGKGQDQQDKLEQRQRVETQKQAKLNRDRELNLIQKRALDEKSIRAQVKQLIQSNKVERQPGEIGFQFVDNKKIKKVYISDEQHRHLSKGLLSIVSFNNEYIFVPKAIAEKIIQRDADLVVYVQSKIDAEASDEADSDPYKDYVIPDDLMW